MSAKSYHWCVTPECKNTTKNAPQKLFIAVPKNPARRRKWLKLARRDPKGLSAKSSIYFCEDHFDLSKDMENYLEHKLVGVKRIVMKKDCVPTRFECQPDRVKRSRAADASRPVALKRQRRDLIKDAITDVANVASTSQKSVENVPEEVMPAVPTSLDKGVQVSFAAQRSAHFRSTGIQCSVKRRDLATSPCRAPDMKVASTSPFKVAIVRGKLGPSSREVLPKKRLFEVSSEQSDSESSVAVSSSQQQTSDSSFNEVKLKLQQEESVTVAVSCTMQMIEKKPRFYVGIPNKCYFFVDMLQKHTKIKKEHILLCLKKIRLHTTFLELGDNFGISASYASKIFSKNIPTIAQYLRPFVKAPENAAIKRNLPVAFRAKYWNVSFIIDCLEIEIEKPSKALHQVLTWSEYKKRNTIKYLISCTPDGYINFISAGYGGRISDVQLVETSKFLEILPTSSCILADRGFKHLEPMLLEKGFVLLRPPSVATGQKLSKQGVKQTKEIASLRIHVERVIRRVREFAMLKGHSVINHNMIGILDEIIFIACALINLQGPLFQ